MKSVFREVKYATSTIFYTIYSPWGRILLTRRNTK